MEKPSLLASFLFILLLTGPPKFRFRDPEASLYSELDLATIINILVWVVAGIWVLWRVCEHVVGKRPPLSFGATHRWALLLIAILGLATPISLAPALSLFKVYQVGVLFCLGLIFVQRYGAKACLQRLFVGYLGLCGLIVCFFVMRPDLVVLESETGALRLAGRGIAETGIAACFAILLLFALRKRRFHLVTVTTGALLGVLLFYSLMRTSYVVVALFLAMLLWKLYPGKKIVGPALVLCAGVLVISFVGYIPDLGAYRDPESLWTLSDRVLLWEHFLVRTFEESPWLGFGFVSGTRAVGMEFHPQLGSGHSIFFEVFVGGGIIALSVFLVLFGLMVRDAAWLFFRSRDRLSFTGAALFMGVFLIGLIGGEMDAGQIGFAFWMLVSLLPYLRRRANLESEVRLRSAPLRKLRVSEQST